MWIAARADEEEEVEEGEEEGEEESDRAAEEEAREENVCTFSSCVWLIVFIWSVCNCASVSFSSLSLVAIASPSPHGVCDGDKRAGTEEEAT